MQRTHILVPLAAFMLALSVTAQTGRTMKLMAPVVIGHTASIVMEHPPSLAGHQFAMAMCSPSYPGSLPISIPGVAQGVLRLDPLAYGVLGIGVLDTSGQSPALTFPVPNDPLLVGASFDVQGADIDGTGLITLTDNDLEIEVAAPPLASLSLIWIPSGVFQMGSPEPANQPPYYNGTSSQPVHPVVVSRPFWIGKFEVTQSHYSSLVGVNPSYFQGVSVANAPNRPVESLSWQDASDFCDLMNVQEAAAGRLPSGYAYRLPTEAEWEYACRANTATEWSFGNWSSCQEANFLYEQPLGSWCNVGQTTVVGSYPANVWGLHDMHGNVPEWCLDLCNPSVSYQAGTQVDPLGVAGSFRVARGGMWTEGANQCRSAYRMFLPIGHPASSYTIGFRLVCAPSMQ